jgi:hypothetical protein
MDHRIRGQSRTEDWSECIPGNDVQSRKGTYGDDSIVADYQKDAQRRSSPCSYGCDGGLGFLIRRTLEDTRYTHTLPS